VTPAPPASGPGPLTGIKGIVRIEEPSARQRAIARRAAEARATVPDLELRAGVDMDACAALGAAHGYSTTALLVRACALALRRTPRANAAYRDGRFELYSRVNVGLTVATDDAFVVPAVLDADLKSLGELTAEIDQLAGRAFAGELAPPDLSGATFTLTDLGAFGITAGSAIINPPQAAVLAVGGVQEVPVVRAGVVRPGLRAELTLVSDHRILYGAQAAAFLAAIKSLLEHAPKSLG
jgi:pyruvate dehydrogenase E2 component (dihydrolipoamide acetyltransferase)